MKKSKEMSFRLYYCHSGRAGMTRCAFSPMPKISAIILTKNSEDLLADCIESIKELADEIIVIDDNSTDRTVDLAKHIGARVENSKTIPNNFAEKRNLGLKKAKGKWIFYIDADERVTPELSKSIQSITNLKKPEYQAYKIQRKNYYFGNHEWPFIESLERLFEKSSLKSWYGPVHETPKIDGKTGELKGFLLHYTHRDLTSMVNKTIEWSKIEAELRLNSNHPPVVWWRFPRVMLTAFFNSYIRQKGYKAGAIGLLESIYQSFSMFITYARLWEMQQTKKQ
jgi:glycosyltransferase involved in cell wall biosynthesis